MSNLYIVATPIGNLDDITLRAKKILQNVEIIIAENTYNSKKLLKKINSNARIIQYNDHSKEKDIEYILDILSSNDIALITDAGTPGICDPGALIVKISNKYNHKIIPIPGPSSIVAAFSVSGISSNEFQFIGFLPKKQKARQDKILEIKNSSIPTLMFESPHRFNQTIKDIEKIMPEREIFIAKEITKIFETLIHGNAEKIQSIFSKENIKGEFVIIVNGDKKKKNNNAKNNDIEKILKTMKRENISGKVASKIVSENFNISKSSAYKLFLDLP
tara:strand:- start:3397 stop:4221 length:825 start_codon:yes stop_codon:yes gene_type:complete